MDKLIYIIRHGQTDHNRLKIIQGSGVDSNLNEIGRIQRMQFFDHYKDKVSFEKVIHSALKRTKQTVKPWLEIGIPSYGDARINEMSWGDYEGQKGSPELSTEYNQVVQSWSIGNYDARLRGAESAQELYDRLANFLYDLKARKEKTILVCSHGRALRCLMCLINGQHLREMKNYSHSNTGLYLIKQTEEQFSMLTINDLAHRTELDATSLEFLQSAQRMS